MSNYIVQYAAHSIYAHKYNIERIQHTLYSIPWQIIFKTILIIKIIIIIIMINFSIVLEAPYRITKKKKENKTEIIIEFYFEMLYKEKDK